MRMAEAPRGGARISYAVLATVLASLGGALLAVVAWPILTTEQTCGNDATGLCGLALGLLFYTVGFWLVLAWLAYAFRLGWLFWVAVVVGQLVCVQAAVAWVSLWPVLALLLVVPLAAWLTSPGPLSGRRPATYGRVPRQRLLLVVGGCAVLVVQLAVWLWRLLA